MQTTTIPLGKSETGYLFPRYHGTTELLSWSIGAYHTVTEERLGFPRMRTVIRAMLENGRADQVEMERREMVKGSFNSVFGHNAKIALNVIEQEIRAFNQGIR